MTEMNIQKKIPLIVAGLLVVFYGAPGFAQDEGDRLIAKDGGLVIYRTEDGKVKIVREGAGDDEWVALVDPDNEGRIIIRDMDVNHRYEFRGNAPVPPRFEMEWDGDWPGGIDREDIIVRMKDAEDLADRIRSRVIIGDESLALIQEGAAERRELAEKEAESSRLAREWRKAEASERVRLEKELDALLDELFEAKEDVRREELERLNERVKELEHRIQERQSQKQEIISRRKSRLLGEDDPLAW